MKKILLSVLILSFTAGISYAKPYDFLSAPTAGNSEFMPIYEHDFEKNETLDFKNNPESYQNKREVKEKFLDYQEGKVDVPPMAKTQFNLQNSGPGSNNMQFVRDENGKIRIKSY